MMKKILIKIYETMLIIFLTFALAAIAVTGAMLTEMISARLI